MPELQNGIVIKYDSIKKRIILFDKVLGKIEGYIYCKNFKNINLCNGSYINYHLINNKNTVKISEIIVIDVPLELAKINILFLHHILELCYFYLPEQMQLTELFDLVTFGLYSFEKLSNDKRQKLFLIKFFLILGTYPENEYLKTYLPKILALPVDSIIDGLIDLLDEEELEMWINNCITNYPKFYGFNTISYLKRINVL